MGPFMNDIQVVNKQELDEVLEALNVSKTNYKLMDGVRKNNTDYETLMFFVRQRYNTIYESVYTIFNVNMESVMVDDGNGGQTVKLDEDGNAVMEQVTTEEEVYTYIIVLGTETEEDFINEFIRFIRENR